MAARRRTTLWSPEALNDLDEIWDHYARVTGPPTADKLLRDINGAREAWEHDVKTNPDSDAGRLAKQRLEQIKRPN